MLKQAKPFLKWAGGKTQLIKQISENFPNQFLNKKFNYIEPFVGSGAVLFWILNNFNNLEKIIINDINQDLINVYKTIQLKPKELILILEEFQNEFYLLDSLKNNLEKKKEYFYNKRDLFNLKTEDKINQSALFIFLNKTCFNGLYRVNKNNKFNVPIGSYKKPLICDKKNILEINKILQKVKIICSDFEKTINYLNKDDENNFFYLDPPYKPLNKTSNFNSYSILEFNDKEQSRLKKFCDLLNKKDYKFILSNSDLKNQNIDNNFFDNLYSEFIIQRIKAKRSINSNSQKRGELNELLIKNYK